MNLVEVAQPESTAEGAWFPVGKEGAVTNYVFKSVAEEAEGQICFDIAGKDIRVLQVVDGVLFEDTDLLATLEAQDARAAIPPISPRQIRLALVSSGTQLSEIDSAINALDEPHKTLARIEWEYSSSFERLNPLVGQIAAILNASDQEIDDLWTMAFTL